MIRLSQEIVSAVVSTHYHEGAVEATRFLKGLLEKRGILITFQESRCLVKGIMEYPLEDRIGIQEGWYTFDLKDPSTFVIQGEV